jgi:hypothetical protein
LRTTYRSDGNAKKLDERARAHGVSIWRAERPFDRIWGLAGITLLVEYKNPETGYGRAGLNPIQSEIARNWRGGKIHVIDAVEDVDAVVALMRKMGRLVRDLTR